MKLKHPYWLALAVTFGMMVVGYACFKIPSPDFFRGPDWEQQVIGIGFLLAVVGFFGFVATVIFWYIARIVSFIRLHHPKGRG